MAKLPSKQRCIRFGGDIEQQVAELAEREDLPFSITVRRLVKLGLKQMARAESQHQAAA
jgi:hypothetical protein